MAAGAPLRLLFVTADLRVGGAERHLATLLPALDRSRIEPSVCCLQGRGPFLQELTAHGIPTHTLDVGYERRALLGAARRLRAHIRAVRPDVVMTQGTHAGAIGRLAARLAGVRTVIVWKHNAGHLGHHGRSERWADRALGSLTSRYFGVTNGQLTYLVDYLGLDPEKLRVINNAVDPSVHPETPRDSALSRELGFPDDAFVIAVVAVIRAEKDHHTVVRAFRRVAAELPGARLVIVGDGDLRGEVEELCRLEGVDSKVHFTGNRFDISGILAGVDVVALASVTIETFPYSVLEAMGAGRPAVCTAVGGLPELIEDGVTGFLVPPRAPGQMARRLLEIGRDPDRGREMGAAARDRLERRFSLDRAADKLAGEIEEAVRDTGRA